MRDEGIDCAAPALCGLEKEIRARTLAALDHEARRDGRCERLGWKRPERSLQRARLLARREESANGVRQERRCDVTSCERDAQPHVSVSQVHPYSRSGVRVYVYVCVQVCSAAARIG
eukprot:1644957-Prymnesium_polylepis.2